MNEVSTLKQTTQKLREDLLKIQKILRGDLIEWRREDFESDKIGGGQRQNQPAQRNRVG